MTLSDQTLQAATLAKRARAHTPTTPRASRARARSTASRASAKIVRRRMSLVLLFANTIPTAASLVLSLLSQGLDAPHAIKTRKGDEDEEDEADEADEADKKDKKDKKGKQEVGRTGLTPPCLLRPLHVRIIQQPS